MSNPSSSLSPTRGVALAELLLGIGIVALGLFIVFEISQIQVSPAYAKVGPTLFPSIVAGALILLGLLLAVQALRAKAPSALDETPHAPSDWRAIVAISVGLWLQILLFESAGFIIASALLFFCVAYAFGSRRYLRDAAIAIVLAVIVYVGFSYGLDLQLPPGVFEGIF
jgi:putative tricarboxylic transport membrane protein